MLFDNCNEKLKCKTVQSWVGSSPAQFGPGPNQGRIGPFCILHFAFLDFAFCTFDLFPGRRAAPAHFLSAVAGGARAPWGQINLSSLDVLYVLIPGQRSFLTPILDRIIPATGF